MVAVLFIFSLFGLIFSIIKYRKNRINVKIAQNLEQGGYVKYPADENCFTLLTIFSLATIFIILFGIVLLFLINSYGDIDKELDSYQNSNVLIKQYIESQTDKSSEKVQRELQNYVNNKTKIKELENALDNCKKFKWILYFGG